MKNLKTLVHTIHCELKKDSPTLKKGHIYELVSAYCGYGSYAAYQADLSFNKVIEEKKELAQGQCFERALELNFDASNSLLVSECIAQQMNISCQLKIQLEKVFHHIESIKCSDAKIDYDGAVIFSLKLLIDEGSSEACFLAIVICTDVVSAYKEDPDNRSAEYWHNKRLVGAKLNELQEEVADNFVHVKDYSDLLHQMVSTNIAEGFLSPIAIKPISDYFDEQQEGAWTSLFNESPYMVLDALDFVFGYAESTRIDGLEKVYMDWLACYIVLDPSRAHLAEKVSNCATNSEKWFWYFFGLKHNIDITKDDYYAIHADTGEDYDDYGPIAVDGYDSISLPVISDDLKAEIKRFATTLVIE